MDASPAEPESSPQKALALAAFFTVVAIAQLQKLQTAFATPLSDAWGALATSPWAVATMADYVVGALFASLYLSYRPALVAALLTPFLGSFAVLLYMAAALVHTRDIVAALLPRTGSLEICMPSKYARSVFLAFAGLLVAFWSICGWAWLHESLQDGYKVIKRVPWIEMTFLDNLGGLVFTVTFVIVREGGLSFSVAGWLLAFVFLGNGATCVYVMLMAREAMELDVSFEERFLSKRYSHS